MIIQLQQLQSHHNISWRTCASTITGAITTVTIRPRDLGNDDRSDGDQYDGDHSDTDDDVAYDE